MSVENPESFVFYESFFTTIDNLPNQKMQNDLYRAVCLYGLFDKKPSGLSKTAEAIFKGFVYQIDSAKKNRKRGRPANNKKDVISKNTASDDVILKNTIKNAPNGNVNGNVNENANVFLGDASASHPAAREKNKHSYGDFHNVWLTSEEYANLAYQLGSTWKAQLEKLSAYKKSHKKFKSDDDYATLKLWRTNALAKQEAKRDSNDSDPEDTKRREDMLDKAWDDAIEDLWADAKKLENKGENHEET